MSSASGYSFTFSFPIWMPFIYFSYLIAVTRFSITMLNRSGKSVHSCVFPDLRGNFLSFWLLNMMLAVGLSYISFIMLIDVLFLESFYHKWMSSFVRSLFCISWDDHMIFILQLLICCITLIDSRMLNHLCIPGINSTLSWCMILFMHFWIWFASILLRIFVSVLSVMLVCNIFSMSSLSVWFWYSGYAGLIVVKNLFC